jgi:hypothetical protein
VLISPLYDFLGIAVVLFATDGTGDTDGQVIGVYHFGPLAAQ